MSKAECARHPSQRLWRRVGPCSRSKTLEEIQNLIRCVAADFRPVAQNRLLPDYA
jgi:hypothetical protein